MRTRRCSAKAVVALCSIPLASCMGGGDAAAGAEAEARPPEVALVSDRGGAGLDLYLHVLGSSELTRLTSDSASDYGPQWSPDGDRILFESDVGGDLDIYVIGADGSGRTNLTRRAGYDGGGSYSPDGATIVFTSTRDAIAEGHDGRDVWLMNADGSGLRRLTRNEMYEGAPRFSPDGSRIVFCRQVVDDERGRDGEIFVMDRDGADPTRLTDRAGFDCLADWSPDGTRLAFHGCGPDGCHIWVMNVDGGELRKLTDAHTGNWPIWSPDGEWIAYTATVDDQTDIWIVRPDGTDARAVTDHPGRDEVAVWRPRP